MLREARIAPKRQLDYDYQTERPPIEIAATHSGSLPIRQLTDATIPAT